MTALASYGTERGAQRYAHECKRAWPEKDFRVCLNPRDVWRYGVAVYVDGKRVAYVAKRPRGGVKRV